jgi:hypothetical protein
MHDIMAPRLRLCLPVFAALLLAACKVSVSSSTADDAKANGAGSGDAKPDGGGDADDGDGDGDGGGGAKGPSDITAPEGGDDGDAGGTIAGKTAGQCEDSDHQIGDEWKDDCNTCNCNKEGKVICTRMACNVEDGKNPH